MALEQTSITIQKQEDTIKTNTEEGSSNEETSNTDFLLYDDSKTTWNHRELLFTEPGTYHISAVVTDGTEVITTDTDITIVNDEAPAADFTLNGDGNNVYQAVGHDLGQFYKHNNIHEDDLFDVEIID